MKHVINAKNEIVTHAIDGLLAGAYGHALTRLDGYPHIKVVLRADWDKQKVAVISGGGSGHEPAHAGFVGRGMLTAAVCGEIFASPSVDAVLAAIIAVTGTPGCLLIVKNYTGDRLNFGLAAERAKGMGYKVDMVIVSDDVALPDTVQPRGIAGTLFVHKIAGDLAEHGETLEEVSLQAAAAAEATRSMGLAITNCHVPGQPAENRLSETEAELGLGIHGEPGLETIAMQAADVLVKQLLDKLIPSAQHRESQYGYGVMINNLGGLTPIEMNIVTRAVLNSPLAQHCQLVFGPAQLMTALDMRGFSVTLIELNEIRVKSLLSDVDPYAWIPGAQIKPHKPVSLPELRPRQNTIPASAHPERRSRIESAIAAIISHEDELNALDSKIGDGDTGSTFATAAKAVAAQLDTYALADVAILFQQLGETLAESMGGTSGVLASIFFTRVGNALNDSAEWADAVQAGCDAIQAYGGARPGDRTLLDTLYPAVEALSRNNSLADIATAAMQGARSTAEIQIARAGRAAYVTNKHLSGVADPGAMAVAYIFAGLAE